MQKKIKAKKKLFAILHAIENIIGTATPPPHIILFDSLNYFKTF